MKFRQLVALATALLCLGVASAHAELIATPLTGDSRLVQFGYDEDNTFLVLTKPKAVTHIQFAPDETLQSVAAGDTAQWELTPTKNRKNLFVKPKYEDLETSMSVITDKRTYQFVLKSTGDGKKWYQRVSWLYSGTMLLESDAQLDAGSLPSGKGSRQSSQPSALGETSVGLGAGIDPIKLDGLKPENLSFSYSTSGSAAFRPVMVFDDGRFTYFKMPADLQELPALFAVIEGQDYALVNYHIKGDYMVAQRLLDVAVLKLGKAEVRVTKYKSRTGLFGTSIGSGEGG